VVGDPALIPPFVRRHRNAMNTKLEVYFL
jgi:hypothetical protein